jgi:hypothetical protein
VILLVVTRTDSAAERALSERLCDCLRAPSPGGRRVLRTLTIGHDPSPAIARILAELADCPPAPESSRGIAVAHETVRELPTPSAVGF